MRIAQSLLLTLLLALAPVALRAEEAPASPDAPTAQLPKSCDLCVRLPALDRIDQLAKDMALVLELFGGDEVKAMLAQGAPSEMLLGMFGIDGTLVDRARAVYFGTLADDPIVLIPAAAGATLATPLDLGDGHTVTLADGLLTATRPALREAERRGAPAAMLGGDFSVHVFVSDITERHKEEIEKGFAQMQAMAGGVPIPGGAEIMQAMFGLFKGGLYAVESLDYALTWQGEGAVGEGQLGFKEGSGLRKFFARAGAPSDPSLAGLLPKNALFYADTATAADWPTKELTEFAAAHLGPKIGGMIQQSMALSQALQGATTGRTAMSFSMTGFFGVNASSVAELREGVDASAMLRDFDAEKLSESLKAAGVPVAVKLDKDVAKHGETSMHRWSFHSDDPSLAMLSMMQTYVAVEGRYLCTVNAMTGETDMRELLDRVRAGSDAAHPHLAAMARLARGRNLGITFNVGQLKSFGMLLGAMAPEAGQALAMLPDALTLSTSITFHDGNIQWRGDWPLKEIGQIVEKMRAAFGERGGAEKPEKEEGEGCGCGCGEEEEDFK